MAGSLQRCNWRYAFSIFSHRYGKFYQSFSFRISLARCPCYLSLFIPWERSRSPTVRRGPIPPASRRVLSRMQNYVGSPLTLFLSYLLHNHAARLFHPLAIAIIPLLILCLFSQASCLPFRSLHVSRRRFAAHPYLLLTCRPTALPRESSL